MNRRSVLVMLGLAPAVAAAAPAVIPDEPVVLGYDAGGKDMTSYALVSADGSVRMEVNEYGIVIFHAAVPAPKPGDTVFVGGGRSAVIG